MLVSCVSIPEVPKDASVMEIVQKGQEATDRDRHNLAIHYYNLILERFPEDAASICMAEYEIALIHYKQNKLNTAKSEFENLLKRYEQIDSELLPQEYKILSGIVLKKINGKI